MFLFSILMWYRAKGRSHLCEQPLNPALEMSRVFMLNSSVHLQKTVNKPLEVDHYMLASEHTTS